MPLRIISARLAPVCGQLSLSRLEKSHMTFQAKPREARDCLNQRRSVSNIAGVALDDGNR